MNMRRILGTLLLVTLIFMPNSMYAQDEPPDYQTHFLNTHVGARALGMGAAFVTLSEDASAVYWNPAGLSFLEGFSFHGSTSSIIHRGADADSSGNEGYNNKSFAIAKSFQSFGIALGYLQYNADDLHESAEQGMPGGMSHSVLYLSGGYRPFKDIDFSLGFTLTKVMPSIFRGQPDGISNTSSRGSGVSLGMLYKYNDDFNIGLVMQAGFDLEYSYENSQTVSETTVRVPYLGKGGFSYKAAKGITIAADGEMAVGWAYGTLNAGVEVSISEIANIDFWGMDIYIRTGILGLVKYSKSNYQDKVPNEGKFCTGLGLIKKWRNNLIRLDIGYANWAKSFSEHLIVSLTFVPAK